MHGWVLYCFAVKKAKTALLWICDVTKRTILYIESRKHYYLLHWGNVIYFSANI